MAAADVTDGPLRAESIPTIDLRLFSQSELFSLSLCSSSSALNTHQNDLVLPKIDRTVFNDSAASRKQTYSPVRLAPPLSSRRRIPHLNAPAPASQETERAENSRIVAALTALFSKQANPNGVTLPNTEHTTSFSILPDLANRDVMVTTPNDLMSMSYSMNRGFKRKRGRPRKEKGVQDGASSNWMNGGLKGKRGRPRKDGSMPASTAMVVVPEAKNEGNEDAKEMVVVQEANYF